MCVCSPNVDSIILYVIFHHLCKITNMCDYICVSNPLVYIVYATFFTSGIIYDSNKNPYTTEDCISCTLKN